MQASNEGAPNRGPLKIPMKVVQQAIDWAGQNSVDVISNELYACSTGKGFNNNDYNNSY